MHVRRLIALAAAALALASASSTLAAPLLAAAPEQLQPGVTTYSQVIAALGEPDSETMRTGGYRSTKYGVTSAHERLLTFVPLVKFFVERCKGCAATVVLTFQSWPAWRSPTRCRGTASKLHSRHQGRQPGQQAPEPKDNP